MYLQKWKVDRARAVVSRHIQHLRKVGVAAAEVDSLQEYRQATAHVAEAAAEHGTADAEVQTAAAVAKADDAPGLAPERLMEVLIPSLSPCSPVYQNLHHTAVLVCSTTAVSPSCTEHHCRSKTQVSADLP